MGTNYKRLATKWRKLDNPEIMGYEAARKAGYIANFFDSLRFVCYDTYHTRNFNDYIAGLVRGCQTNENEYEGISIGTTNDLHDIVMTSYGVSLFEDFLLNHMGWDAYFEFYYEQAKAS